MRKAYFVILTGLFMGLSSAWTLSQSGGTFVMQRSVIAGGGDRSTGGAFIVNGTIGQHLAGTQSTGGTFDLRSGFWGAGGALTPRSTAFDFDGDGKADVSIFRPPVGEWYYQRSSNGVVNGFQFGSSTDKVTPGDFTGDGKTDIAFWRPSTGNWYVLRSEDSTYYAFPFGASGDVPAPADFDGDGKAD